MAFYDYQIATGYNAAGSLTNVEALTGTDGNLFLVVSGWASFDPGSPRTGSDRLLDFLGFPTTRWLSNILYVGQYKYLYNTILSGAYSGPVTIRTTTNFVGIYANYNAEMKIPVPAQLQTQGSSYVNVPWTFTGLVAL